ncbi:MAG: hypothetical protein IIY43_06730, partial [Oscillospiraceae bacterium]|nr:hypothetical protein [Oscillospiraceae bacterium]
AGAQQHRRQRQHQAQKAHSLFIRLTMVHLSETLRRPARSVVPFPSSDSRLPSASACCMVSQFAQEEKLYFIKNSLFFSFFSACA